MRPRGDGRAHAALVAARVRRARARDAEDASSLVRARVRGARPSESPFELGRTELCHGDACAARVAYARRASACAPLWSVSRPSVRRPGPRAPARVARRRRHRPPRARAGARELTPQELEVALAVAAGRRTARWHAALSVSPKTVEVHLSRVFRKLGLRSRTELAVLLAGAK